MSTSLSYAGSLVRQHDPDRFFLTLLQPVAVRPALWTLLAFHYEVAKTREVVSDPTLGLIRLQWWRDALERIYAGHPAPVHEILEPLAAVIRQYSLPFNMFDALLMGREFDLDDHKLMTIADFKNYIRGTATPLARLMLLVSGDPADGVDHISCAYGIAGLMRAVTFHAQQGRCFVPEELGRLDELFRDHDKRQVAMRALYNEACQEIVAAGHFKSKMLCRMGDATRLYLNHMRHLDYDLLDQRYALTPPFFHLRMFLKG